MAKQEKKTASWTDKVEKVKRIRGRPLQRIRQRHFSNNPLCVHCLEKGLYVLATKLDHILALDNGGQDVEENRQGLCADCHVAKTIIDMGYKKKVAIGIDGFPITT